MRKKVGLFSVAVIIILCMASISVLGEENGWTCPQCGRTGNTRKFCGGCGSPAPDLEKDNHDTTDASQGATQDFGTIGNVVTFGRYEQDNDLTNGPEEIEWLVLDVEDGKALLLSKYGLDAKPYNGDLTDITWEKCTLRKWLNQDFLQAAFSADEQRAILTTTVDNSSAQGYSGFATNGGNNTNDQVFLLSYAEANQYFNATADVDKTQVMSPTAYAIAQGVYTSEEFLTEEGKAAGWWWLRSPGISQLDAALVASDGSRFELYVVYDSACVRPAFWLDLESNIFQSDH